MCFFSSIEMSFTGKEKTFKHFELFLYMLINLRSFELVVNLLDNKMISSFKKNTLDISNDTKFFETPYIYKS